jgi:hypothetical protein
MQLNVLNDLAEAMKALDGKKIFPTFEVIDSHVMHPVTLDVLRAF